jgi:IS30 family transposase
VLSSRRVKKGPGRRPLSAKRQRFMELRARGWSIRGAAREVGISRSAAANWTRGYTVYRDGVAVRFVEPLDRLEVREISARYLSQQERIEIADLHHEGVGVREISRRLGRSPSTISRELRRNRTAAGGPAIAHLRLTVARARVAHGVVSGAHRDQPRTRPCRRRAAGAPLEPNTDQSATAQAFPRRTRDVAVA